MVVEGRTGLVLDLRLEVLELCLDLCSLAPVPVPVLRLEVEVADGETVILVNCICPVI